VARGLGPDQAGGFFAGTAAFVMVGMLAKLGTQTSLVYFLARLRTRGAPAVAIRRCLRIGLVPVAVAAVLTGVLMAVLAPQLAGLTARGPADPAYVTQLRVLAVFLPLGVLSDTLLAATRGFRTMRPTVVLDKILRPASQVLALVVLTALASHAAAGYTAAWVAPYLLSALLAAVALHQRVPRAPAVNPVAARSTTGSVGTGPGTVYGAPPVIDEVAEHIDARTFWRFTGPRAVASVAQLALNRFDVLLLAGLAGLKAAAVYAVAGRFIVLGQFANQAINQSVQPRIAERLSLGDRDGANQLYQTATGWLVFAAWPLYLGIAVYAPVYLGIFGAQYRHAGAVVMVLALAMLVATGCGMVDIVLSMAGRTSWNLANVLIALAVTIGLDLLLIPRFGALGAAAGLACAMVANNLLPLIQVGRAVGLHPFGAGTRAAALLSIGCFGVLPRLATGLAGDGPLGLAMAVLVAVPAFGSGAWLLRGPLALDAFKPFGKRRTS